MFTFLSMIDRHLMSPECRSGHHQLVPVDDLLAKHSDPPLDAIWRRLRCLLAAAAATRHVHRLRRRHVLGRREGRLKPARG
jgi:hypothetical protein